MKKTKRKKSEFRQLGLLQAIIAIYTISSVMAKFASGAQSLGTMAMFLGLDFLFLAVYALCWQQMIKKLPLSVAYANRAMALLWSALWASWIFGEQIGKKQMAAIALVIVGTWIVNTDKREEAEDE